MPPDNCAPAAEILLTFHVPLTRDCSHSSLPDITGSGCEHDGVLYRNGQSFQPSCKYQCVCVNGAIGCVTLCAESQPPRVWCQTPRRVKVPGQCCEQWICDEPRRGRKTAPRHAVEGRTPWTLGGGGLLPRSPRFRFPTIPSGSPEIPCQPNRPGWIK